jgi:glutathionylspermidine synthase
MKEDEVFENMKTELISKYKGKWVTIFCGKVVSIGESYDESATKAREKYGEQPMITRLAAFEKEEKYWIL